MFIQSIYLGWIKRVDLLVTAWSWVDLRSHFYSVSISKHTQLRSYAKVWTHWCTFYCTITVYLLNLHTYIGEKIKCGKSYTLQLYNMSLLSDLQNADVTGVKEYFNLSVSQLNHYVFQLIWGHFFWSIHHEIYTQWKGQQAFSNYVKNLKLC